METIAIGMFFTEIAAIIIYTIVFHFYEKYANSIKWEEKMLPCPKCGHKAITVHYTGENNPYFFTAECGAYVRRGEDRIGSTCTFNGKGLPPLTDEQKKCHYFAGYCSDAPHFATRKGAVMWWNKVACKKDG